MSMRLKTVVILGIAVILGFIPGCMPLETRPVQPPTPPRFSYEPPANEIKKLDITFGVVAPRYDANTLVTPIITPEDRARMTSISGQFTKSISVDLEKMIIARGFKTKGPFVSLEDMTYPDKKGSDLTISPKVFITTNYSTTGLGTLFFRASGGILTVTGFMEMMILEPLSGEKMWMKKIDFEPTSANYEFSYYRNDKGIPVVQVDTRPEALKTALERIYPKIMDTAWKYLHPDEVAFLKKESREVRERKRY